MFEALKEFITNNKLNKKHDLSKVFVGKIVFVKDVDVAIEEGYLKCEYKHNTIKNYAFFVKGPRQGEYNTYSHIASKKPLLDLNKYVADLKGSYAVTDLKPIENIFTEYGLMTFKGRGNNAVTTKQILQLEEYLNKQDPTKHSKVYIFESNYPEVEEIDDSLKDCLKIENDKQIEQNQEKNMGK